MLRYCVELVKYAVCGVQSAGGGGVWNISRDNWGGLGKIFTVHGGQGNCSGFNFPPAHPYV